MDAETEERELDPFGEVPARSRKGEARASSLPRLQCAVRVEQATEIGRENPVGPVQKGTRKREEIGLR